MAELSLKAVSPVTPPTPATTAGPNHSQGPDKDAAAERPNFAQVLKERHSASKSEDKPVSKTAAKKDSSDKPEAKAQAASQPTEVASGGLAAALALSTADGATVEQTAQAVDAALQSGETDEADESVAEDAAALLPQILTTDAANIVATPQVVPANLASQTASLADETATQITVDSDALAASSTGITEGADGANKPATNAGATDDFAQLLKPEIATADTATPVSATNDIASLRQTAVQAFTAAQQMASANPTQQTPPNPPQVINTPVGARGWSEEVGQRLVWTAHQDNGQAEIILTPPQLGRVEVTITMNGEQATANFVAASPAAREALQDAMPRLREILAQSGIQLGQTNVSTGQSGQSQGDASQQHGRSHFGGGPGAQEGDLRSTHSGPWVKQGRGLIDTFA